jgi:hypothetical protein
MLGLVDALGLLSATAFVACLAAGATVADFFTLLGGLVGISSPTNTAPFALLTSNPDPGTPLLQLCPKRGVLGITLGQLSVQVLHEYFQTLKALELSRVEQI